MTVEEYRKDPALNFSLAKILATETPAHFLEARENPDREETIAMRMGTAVHDLLQGKLQEYAIKPAFNPFTRNQADTWHGNKTWCKEWMSEQILPMLSADEYAAVVGMRDALSENPVFQMLQQMCPVVETPVPVRVLEQPVLHPQIAVACAVQLIIELKISAPIALNHQHQCDYVSKSMNISRGL